ncbi:hypothetical protein EVAR_71716_1 [Eumeta japonica]|uniref:Uncharacterized protein n=1 Tax=Eumeta variegata TaxID=151549 RepID=A0A4C1TNL2_EUMVA|nr:hypothetical protein EVAR_71716_1 [Eumeta japonica]
MRLCFCKPGTCNKGSKLALSALEHSRGVALPTSGSKQTCLKLAGYDAPRNFVEQSVGWHLKLICRPANTYVFAMCDRVYKITTLHATTWQPNSLRLKKRKKKRDRALLSLPCNEFAWLQNKENYGFTADNC